MAVNEQIITGRKFRKLINETTKLWQRISFWTKASDVEFNDGKTAEAKLGAINGITSDLSCTDESIAASMASVARSLTANGTKFYFDYKDGKYGYNTDPNRGADTFSPFNSQENIHCVHYMESTKFSMNKANTLKTDIDRSKFHRLLSYSITSAEGNVGALCMYNDEAVTEILQSNNGGKQISYPGYHYISWHPSNGFSHKAYKGNLYEFSDDEKVILQIPYWRGQSTTSDKRIMIAYY